MWPLSYFELPSAPSTTDAPTKDLDNTSETPPSKSTKRKVKTSVIAPVFAGKKSLSAIGLAAVAKIDADFKRWDEVCSI